MGIEEIQMAASRTKPGCWFGSKRPKVIYVGMRCDEDPGRISDRSGCSMLAEISETLNRNRKDVGRVSPSELRIYNLADPEHGRKMSVSPEEMPGILQRLRRIAVDCRASKSVRRILMGGVSGPMPMAAVALKCLLPGVRLEICTHHVARGHRLKLRQAL